MAEELARGKKSSFFIRDLLENTIEQTSDSSDGNQGRYIITPYIRMTIHLVYISSFALLGSIGNSYLVNVNNNIFSVVHDQTFIVKTENVGIIFRV